MAQAEGLEESQTITYKGEDIESLPPETLREALRGAFRDLTAYDAQLSDEGRDAAAREEDFQRLLSAQRDYFATAADYQTRLVGAAAAYNQIIVLGGYAAFFAIWSAVAHDVAPVIRLASATSMTVSLVIYVTWTVVGMLLTQAHNMGVLATFGDGVEGFEERYKQALADGNARITKQQRWWKLVVCSAGLTGFTSAVMIGGAAIWAALDLPATKPLPAPANVATLASSKVAAKDADCRAKTVALLSQAQTGPGTRATNPATGEHAVLIGKKWAILPKCGGAK